MEKPEIHARECCTVSRSKCPKNHQIAHISEGKVQKNTLIADFLANLMP